MYNRYIPQSDGSFRKNRISETPSTSNRSQAQHKMSPPCPPPVAPPSIPAKSKPSSVRKPQQAEGFLRQLLPQGLDTGDLLIGVLLLLMAGDCQEDKNTALLTLALYLFL